MMGVIQKMLRERTNASDVLIILQRFPTLRSTYDEAGLREIYRRVHAGYQQKVLPPSCCLLKLKIYLQQMTGQTAGDYAGLKA